jgi:hypothetical protein
VEYFIKAGIVLIGVVMSGVWKAQCGGVLIGWLEGNIWMVSMIIRWVLRSKVPEFKSQEMSLLDWVLLTHQALKNVYLKKSLVDVEGLL